MEFLRKPRRQRHSRTAKNARVTKARKRPWMFEEQLQDRQAGTNIIHPPRISVQIAKG